MAQSVEVRAAGQPGLYFFNNHYMKILSIETSCDETAVSLVEITDTAETNGVRVLGNALLSQAKLHEQYGGVFPNLAKREHAKNLGPLLLSVLKEAGALQQVRPLL